MQRLILIILSTFVFLAGPALAKSPEATNWIVSQRSGDARVIRSGLQPASLTVSAALKPGDVILTGPTGRATLARGSDYVVVAPRSELRLPASPQAGGFTRVVQTIGTMLFKVRRTGVPHFAVDTPMLAAVVKGTTFTIVVGKDRSAVQVIEGAVEVIAVDGGMKELVAGGRTVFIDRNDPKRLIIADARTLGNSDPSSDDGVKITGSRDESLMAIVGLTGGLVRAEAVPAANSRSASIPDTIIATVAPAVDRGVPTTADLVSTVTNPSAAAPAVVAIAQNPNVPLPAATVPAVTAPTVPVPAATVPAVTVPAVTTPTVPVPAVTVPAVTVPAVTVPAVTVPAVTVPAVTVPAVTTPTVPVPAVTVPAVTVPTVPVPAVTVPAVTVPTVPVPAVTVPAVTVPTVPTVVPLPKL